MTAPRCRLCDAPAPQGKPQPAHPGQLLCDRCAACGEPALPTVARRQGRRELVLVTHAPAVLSRLAAAGGVEREPGVFVLPRRTGAEVAPC